MKRVRLPCGKPTRDLLPASPGGEWLHDAAGRLQLSFSIHVFGWNRMIHVFLPPPHPTTMCKHVAQMTRYDSRETLQDTTRHLATPRDIPVTRPRHPATAWRHTATRSRLATSHDSSATPSDSGATETTDGDVLATSPRQTGDRRRQVRDIFATSRDTSATCCDPMTTCLHILVGWGGCGGGSKARTALGCVGRNAHRRIT